MDKEYIKGIIGDIVGGKEKKGVEPSSATMEEVMGVVRSDTLECMRDMCRAGEIAARKTLNSVSLRCV